MDLQNQNKELRVVSVLSYLDGAAETLLDPENLNDTADYYLLENLGAGLVYENWKHLELWQARLAASWEKISEYIWSFKLREDIRWSDGSHIEASQVLDHFRRLQSGRHRHLHLIKQMESINYDSENNSIVFKSKHPIHEGLLHELALSDALLLHPRNLEGDWSISSGPYYVAKQSRQGIQLKANEFFQEKPEIQTVNFLSLDVKNYHVDVRKRPAFSMRKSVDEIRKRFDQIWMGQPSIIYYFSFNSANSWTHDANLRKVFAQMFQREFKHYEWKDYLAGNDQFIPVGYAGRVVEEIDFTNLDWTLLKNKTFIISLEEYLKATVLPKQFEDIAKKYECQLEIVYEKSKETFAQLESFSGNQRDPFSSWRFLYSESPLQAFYPQVEDLFKSIMSASHETREKLLVELHRKTLAEAYAVPFLAEYDAIFASDRVDFTDVNPFDMRLRFFEMKWKN